MSENNYNSVEPKKKGGKIWKVLLIAVLGALVVSPIDLIPGDAMTVVGLADDLVYVAGIIGTVASMIKGRNVPSGANVDADRGKYNDVGSNRK